MEADQGLSEKSFTKEELKEFKVFTLAQVEEGLKELDESWDIINNRTKDDVLIPFHEDLITIQRLDYGRLASSFLHIDETQTKNRMHVSWLARVLAISKRDSGDELTESKKKDLKIGDIIIFNPDAGYSLNIKDYNSKGIAEDLYSIWTISINNVLYIDNTICFKTKLKEQLLARHEISLSIAFSALQLKREREQMAKESFGD